MKQRLITAEGTIIIKPTSHCLLVKIKSFSCENILYLSRKQNGKRVVAGGSTVVTPCQGQIWLGDLKLLNADDDPDVEPYAKYTEFSLLEFGASYGSGGIGQWHRCFAAAAYR